MEVTLNNKLLSALNPPEDWSNNPHRHVSVLTKGGKIVAFGTNNLGGVPKFCTSRGKSCHSEMEVIKCLANEDKRKLKKYVMWNIKWTKNGDIASSKPCKACQQTMISMGIQTVVFSTQNGTFQKYRIIDL